MSWSEIIDQTRAVETLRSAVSSERIAHAYLFRGPDGVGKRAVAIEFAKTLLCERDGDAPCDSCRSCGKIDRMLHPDLRVFFPRPSDATDEDVSERLQLLGENRYAAVDFIRRPSLGDPTKSSNKQAIYAVDFVREEIVKKSALTPVEGRYKVIVMTDADQLNPQASNALLKTLEEPTPRSVFILTTSRPDHLLPTILSRCQSLRFEPLPPEEIEAGLTRRQGVDPSLAATLSRMADGSYMEALDLAQNEELLGLRNLVLDYFRMSYSGNIDRQADLVEQASRLGRDQVKNVIELMLRWVRDLTLYRGLADEAVIVNVDQKEAIESFSENLPQADLEAMALLLEEAVGLIERNVHVKLTLTVLSQTLGKAMRGPHSGKLYVPLSEDGLRKSA